MCVGALLFYPLARELYCRIQGGGGSYSRRESNAKYAFLILKLKPPVLYVTPVQERRNLELKGHI